MSLSLVTASDDALRSATSFLVVFMQAYEKILYLFWLAFIVQVMWEGMGMALGSNYRLQETILKMRRIFLVLALATASVIPPSGQAATTDFPALYLIGREIRDWTITKMAANYYMSTDAVQTAIARIHDNATADGYGMTQQEFADLTSSTSVTLPRHYPVCGVEECLTIIKVVSDYIHIDVIFGAGFGLALAGWAIFATASVIAGGMSILALGFGIPNSGWGIYGVFMPIFMGIMGFGLMMMGWALALTLTFFMLDFQLLILSYLGPIFILGYAIDATKSYAEAWTKALIKNVIGSIFVILFALVTAKVISGTGGGGGSFFLGLVMFFAMTRYGLQMAADLVGGIASMGEDIGGTGQSAKASGHQIEQGIGGGSGAAARGQRYESHQQGLQAYKDHDTNDMGRPITRSEPQSLHNEIPSKSNEETELEEIESK